MIVKRVTLSDDTVQQVRIGNMALLTAIGGAIGDEVKEGQPMTPGQRAERSRALACAVLVATGLTEEQLEDMPPEDYAALLNAVSDGVEEMAGRIRPTSEPSAPTSAESSTPSGRRPARVLPISSATSTG